MFAKKILICLFIFNFYILIDAEFEDELFLVSKTSKDEEKNDNWTNFKETQFLIFSTNQRSNQNKLRCEEWLSIEKFCPKYSAQINEAKCFNLNYKRDDVPFWKCELKDLQSELILKHSVVSCEHSRKKNSFKKNTCTLFYYLNWKDEEKQKNDYIVKYRDTSFLIFEQEPGEGKEQLDARNRYKEDNIAYNKSYLLKSVKCVNENYKKSDKVAWNCEFDGLNSELIIDNYGVECKTPNQSDKNTYYKTTCILTYILKWKNLKREDEFSSYKDTEHLFFNASVYNKGKEEPQLECLTLENVCSLYNASTANCKNLNFNKPGKPDWSCEFKTNGQQLNPAVIVSDYSIYCEDEVREYYYLKSQCELNYNLKLKVDQKPDKPSRSKFYSAFKDTYQLTFHRLHHYEEKSEIKRRLKCIYNETSENLCHRGRYYISCKNLNYEKSITPDWNCNFEDLSIRFIVEDYDVNCGNVTDDLTQYVEDTCVLTYIIKLNKTIVPHKETSRLIFEKGANSIGKNAGAQLRCQENESNKLCSMHEISIANCSNLPHEYLHYSERTCEFKGLDSAIQVKEHKVTCEDVNDKKVFDDWRYCYIRNSCYLKYELMKVKKNEQTEDDLADDEKKKNGSNFQIFLSLAIVCFCLSLAIFTFWKFYTRYVLKTGENVNHS